METTPTTMQMLAPFVQLLLLVLLFVLITFILPYWEKKDRKRRAEEGNRVATEVAKRLGDGPSSE